MIAPEKSSALQGSTPRSVSSRQCSFASPEQVLRVIKSCKLTLLDFSHILSCLNDNVYLFCPHLQQAVPLSVTHSKQRKDILQNVATQQQDYLVVKRAALIVYNVLASSLAFFVVVPLKQASLSFKEDDW